MRRAWVVCLLLCFVYLLILLRLSYLQIVKGDMYKNLAVSQHFEEFRIPSLRGSIQSSDGSMIVMNKPSFLVYAKPKEIADVLEFSQKMHAILGLEEKNVLDAISQPNRFWVSLGHHVEPSIAQILEKEMSKGLGFEKETERFYPEASMAASLLGFVGSDENGRSIGYFGLEGYYDRELRGHDGSVRQEKDAFGVPIVLGQEERFEAVDGRNLVLWLDRSVQRVVESELKDAIKRYGAKQGTVTVLDPSTGGVLAMAAYPAYDPSQYSEYSYDQLKNPIIATTYEPGSTFKVLVMSAAIDQGVVSPTTTMEETGPVKIGEYIIRTWNDTYSGMTTMTDVLIHSSNVGMVFVGKKLGLDMLYSYISEYGFGKPTGVDLQEESFPDVRPKKEWAEIDQATATFGQGIAVTPMQMVRAVSAIANDGWLLEPKVVKAIVDERGRTIPIKPKKIRQVIKSSTAHIITEMMIAAVDNGEAKWAKPKGYRIAGKTGTAQIPVAGHYDEKKTIASFVGFAPADDPKFVMLVTLTEPTTSPWGSETAAPVFFRIVKQLFEYYGISPGE